MNYVIALIILAFITSWVSSDAKKRGMKPFAWGLGVFLVLIVFLPLYFIVRKPKLAPVSRTCSYCGFVDQTGGKFCAGCGKDRHGKTQDDYSFAIKSSNKRTAQILIILIAVVVLMTVYVIISK
jgi:hypothetical protein